MLISISRIFWVMKCKKRKVEDIKVGQRKIKKWKEKRSRNEMLLLEEIMKKEVTQFVLSQREG